MLNNITQHDLRYELFALDNSSYLENFYVEYVNDEIVRFLSLTGEVLDLADDFNICTRIAIDLSPELLPHWLK